MPRRERSSNVVLLIVVAVVAFISGYVAKQQDEVVREVHITHPDGSAPHQMATLAETERISRRVLGGTHPNVRLMVEFLRTARAKLRARETLSGNS